MLKQSLVVNNDRDVATNSKRRTRTSSDDVGTPQKENGAYTVGWICAICPEYVAAQTFLDKKHGRPKHASKNDANDYTLGEIGRHNVVIAILPDGEHGTSSAAKVARDMLHSFPNVRIGLLVGIGGGAPSQKHDIRLGDVVVSAPGNGNGGVFQYDFGKTIQDQKFHPTGFLDQPPAVLRAAVNGLKAEHTIEGHSLRDAINSTLEKYPRLRQEYRRPDPSSDRLYQSNVVHSAAALSTSKVAPLAGGETHSTGEGNRADTCGDDPSILKTRRLRTKEEELTIHYGLIASANQIMEDALVRDTLAAEKDVLCFETEAAGLMNHFPCLVVRGICNYSDSHKNKEWEGYAAMAAAAYAKDLLRRIVPNQAEKEDNIFSKVHDTISTTVANAAHIKYNLAKGENIEILDWLTLVDYNAQQSDCFKRQQLGTGQSLLDSEVYQAWLESRDQTLFCSSIPGTGKTTLTSIVAEDLTTRFREDESVGIAYIYFNFGQQGKHQVEDLIASLLKQLVRDRPSLPESVKFLYDTHTKGIGVITRPSIDELSRAFKSVTTQYSKIFIVIDALDECQPDARSRENALLTIFSLLNGCKFNVFITSRFIPDIANLVSGMKWLESRASQESIQIYTKAT